MEFRQLLYFEAIARTGGFRSASELLSIGPATLSEQIKFLEQELGVRLFVRNSRNVALTDAGRALLVRAQKALGELEAARQEMLDLAQLERGQLIVGTLPGMGVYWLASFLASFLKRYPNLNVRLVERWSKQLFRLLDTGDIHVAWVLVPVTAGFELPPGIAMRGIHTGKLVVVVPHAHPLTRLDNLTLEQLAHEPLILTSPDETPRTILDEAFHARGLDPTIVFEANDPTTLVQLAAEGVGVGVTGAGIARKHDKLVAAVPLESGRLRYGTAVTWPEGGPHTKALARFVEFLVDWFREKDALVAQSAS